MRQIFLFCQFSLFVKMVCLKVRHSLYYALENFFYDYLFSFIIVVYNNLNTRVQAFSANFGILKRLESSVIFWFF